MDQFFGAEGVMIVPINKVNRCTLLENNKIIIKKLFIQDKKQTRF